MPRPRDTRVIEYDRQRSLDALAHEISTTFGAIHDPSLEDLDALLERHGWIWDPER